jgi:hypothetical protein
MCSPFLLLSPQPHQHRDTTNKDRTNTTEQFRDAVKANIMRIVQYTQSKSLAETNLFECWTDRLSPSASYYHPQASEPTSSTDTRHLQNISFGVDTQKWIVYHHHRPATIPKSVGGKE